MNTEDQIQITSLSKLTRHEKQRVNDEKAEYQHVGIVGLYLHVFLLDYVLFYRQRTLNDRCRVNPTVVGD